MYLGWYEESPWRVDDLYIAFKQFGQLDCKRLSQESYEILQLLCKMFQEALDNNFDFFISIE